MGKIARKHHYIPQFYLEGFTTVDNNGKLFVLDYKTGKQWLSYSRNIAFQNDLYKVEKEDHIDTNEDVLEKAFAEFESIAAPIIKEMKQKEHLPSGEAFSILLNFVALMYCRVPVMTELSMNPIKKLTKMDLQMIAADKSRFILYMQRLKEEGYDVDDSVDYEQFIEFVMSDRYSIDVNQNYKMKVLLDKVNIVLPLLAERKWTLLLTDDSHGGFICSDNPVALVSLDRLSAFYAPGFGVRNTEVTIALTKNMAIIGRFENEEEVGYVTPKTLAVINSRSSMYSARFIYSAYEDFVFLGKEETIENKKSLLNLIQAGNCR